MDPYDCDELINIFKKIIDMNNWKLEDEDTINKQWFNSKYEVYILVEYGTIIYICKICHSEEFTERYFKRKKIIMQDVENGYKMFSDNRKRRKKISIFFRCIFNNIK